LTNHWESLRFNLSEICSNWSFHENKIREQGSLPFK
jgi:hypothetical protein